MGDPTIQSIENVSIFSRNKKSVRCSATNIPRLHDGGGFVEIGQKLTEKICPPFWVYVRTM